MASYFCVVGEKTPYRSGRGSERCGLISSTIQILLRPASSFPGGLLPNFACRSGTSPSRRKDSALKNRSICIRTAVGCTVSVGRELKLEIPGVRRRGTMANTIEAIPEKTRWEIATKGLTGAYIAISNALKQAVAQNKFEQFNGPLWYEAGKGAKAFADTLG